MFLGASKTFSTGIIASVAFLSCEFVSSGDFIGIYRSKGECSRILRFSSAFIFCYKIAGVGGTRDDSGKVGGINIITAIAEGAQWCLVMVFSSISPMTKMLTF